MKKIRIVIVDDQTLLRDGLAALLNMIPDLQVVGLAPDGKTALGVVEQAHPDVVLMDVRMPGMSGIAVTRELRVRFPGMCVIVLTTFDNDEYVFDALQAGACGYLLKNADPDYLASAIRSAVRGEAVLDPAVTQKVIRRVNLMGSDQVMFSEKLSRREREILSLIADGLANPEIAERLSLAEGTVKNHVSHIFNKLGARDRAHAVRLAAEWGLV
ncbi:MAG: response regulator [Chloroflexota bacterium]